MKMQIVLLCGPQWDNFNGVCPISLFKDCVYSSQNLMSNQYEIEDQYGFFIQSVCSSSSFALIWIRSRPLRITFPKEIVANEQLQWKNENELLLISEWNQYVYHYWSISYIKLERFNSLRPSDAYMRR